MADRTLAWLRRPGRISRMVRALFLPVLALLIWAAITNLGLIKPILLPTPQKLFSVWWAIGDLIPGAFWITLQMVVTGIIVGGLAGLGFGLIFGYSRWARDLLEFSFDALRVVPIFALIPLFLLWFGIGMRPQIALVTLGVMLILTIQTTEAVRNVLHIHVQAALTAGASRFHIYRTVVVPSIIPHILAGLRLAVMAAWGLDVAAEFMGSVQGLGFLMLAGLVNLDSARIIAMVIIFALLAIGSDFLLRALIKRTIRWAQRATAGGLVAEVLGTR
ncbi:MAG: ABC transporter permease [bacterium]|nr:ABC transporter permease [bacterium]MDE0353444.1 ABC transporter permease [bacterium]